MFNSSGKALFFIIGFSKDLHSSSMGTEDNIEASTMSMTVRTISMDSEEIIVTSNLGLQYLMVAALSYTKRRNREHPSLRVVSAEQRCLGRVRRR